MIEFHGRPFLEYLVEELRDAGFERVLLLLGYLPDVDPGTLRRRQPLRRPIAYCGDAARDPDRPTRVRAALDAIDPTFLLLYCDNYWPMQARPDVEPVPRGRARRDGTIYRNTDGYSARQRPARCDGCVAVYDRVADGPGSARVSRSATRSSGATWWSCCQRRTSLQSRRPSTRRWPSEGELLAYPSPTIATTALVRSSVCRSTERVPGPPADGLPRSRRRPEPATAARPSTSGDRRSSSGCPAPARRFALLTRAGYRLFVISNQAGIARGAMTDDDLAAVEDRMLADAADAGGRIDGAYYCRTAGRMAATAASRGPACSSRPSASIGLDLSQTPFIGDDERDGQAADAAGCPVLPGDRRSVARSTSPASLIAGGSIRHHDTTTARSRHRPRRVTSARSWPRSWPGRLRRRRPGHRLLPRLHAASTATGRSRRSTRTSATSPPTTSAASTPSSTWRP